MLSRSIRERLEKITAESPVSAVDLFCGAGGLTFGLLQAGIKVEAGIDIDEQVRHAYVANNPGTKFFAWDVGRNNTRLSKDYSVRQVSTSRWLCTLSTVLQAD
jgi:site-specific DNA-cytosine methylase